MSRSEGHLVTLVAQNSNDYQGVPSRSPCGPFQVVLTTGTGCLFFSAVKRSNKPEMQQRKINFIVREIFKIQELLLNKNTFQNFLS